MMTAGSPVCTHGCTARSVSSRCWKPINSAPRASTRRGVSTQELNAISPVAPDHAGGTSTTCSSVTSEWNRAAIALTNGAAHRLCFERSTGKRIRGKETMEPSFLPVLVMQTSGQEKRGRRRAPFTSRMRDRTSVDGDVPECGFHLRNRDHHFQYAVVEFCFDLIGLGALGEGN